MHAMSQFRSKKVDVTSTIQDVNTELHNKLQLLLSNFIIDDGEYVWKKLFSITASFLIRRMLPFLTVARFNDLGNDGYDMLKETLGVLHAECCIQKKAISLVAYFGYVLVAMINVHASKGWKWGNILGLDSQQWDKVCTRKDDIAWGDAHVPTTEIFFHFHLFPSRGVSFQ